MIAALQANALGTGFLALLWTLAGLAWLQSRDRLPVSGSVALYAGMTAGAIIGVANFGPGGPTATILLGFGGVLVGMNVGRL